MRTEKRQRQLEYLSYAFLVITLALLIIATHSYSSWLMLAWIAWVLTAYVHAARNSP